MSWAAHAAALAAAGRIPEPREPADEPEPRWVSAMDKLERRSPTKMRYNGPDDELGDFLASSEVATGGAVGTGCALCGEPGATCPTSSGALAHCLSDGPPERVLVPVAPWLQVDCWTAWTRYGYRTRVH